MIEQCHKCQSLSGVYLQICDDCMTRFNKLDEIEKLLREFFEMLDQVEEGSEGGEFHPTTISSCRVMHCIKLDDILPRLKELSK